MQGAKSAETHGEAARAREDPDEDATMQVTVAGEETGTVPDAPALREQARTPVPGRVLADVEVEKDDEWRAAAQRRRLWHLRGELGLTLGQRILWCGASKECS